MKSIQKFKKSLNIGFVENTGIYGHCPFQIYYQSKEGHIAHSNLIPEEKVLFYYKAFHRYLVEGCTTVYMSIDFPAMGDIENDFIAVFSCENKEINMCAILYDKETGKILGEIQKDDNDNLRKIFSQFVSVILPLKKDLTLTV